MTKRIDETVEPQAYPREPAYLEAAYAAVGGLNVKSDYRQITRVAADAAVRDVRVQMYRENEKQNRLRAAHDLARQLGCVSDDQLGIVIARVGPRRVREVLDSLDKRLTPKVFPPCGVEGCESEHLPVPRDWTPPGCPQIKTVGDHIRRCTLEYSHRGVVHLWGPLESWGD